MAATPEHQFDVRTLERKVRTGVFTKTQVAEYLNNLPDVSHKGIRLGDLETRERRRVPEPTPRSRPEGRPEQPGDESAPRPGY